MKKTDIPIGGHQTKQWPSPPVEGESQPTTKTPRTDAAAKHSMLGLETVQADFARTLELEVQDLSKVLSEESIALKTANDQITKLKEALRECKCKKLLKKKS